MEFKPEQELIFSYQMGKHLPTTLTLKNTTSTPLVFKFKASSPNKFSIKPNPGLVKQGEQLKILVVAHRDIVQNIENQQIQIQYGAREYSQSRNFTFLLENGSKKDQLNLTIMVTQKETRVKQLQDEMGTYRSMPKSKSSSSPKKSGKLIIIATAAIVGLLLGFFSPISLFG